MSFLDKLERKFGFLAIHNLTLYLVAGQAITFLLVMLLPRGEAVTFIRAIEFTMADFMDGQVWRVFTFMLIPKTYSLIFVAFYLLVLHMMGSALEQSWGAFRYTLFVLIGILGVVLAGIVFPYHSMSSFYVLTTITLAFAILYPNVELTLFFILPVKVKWIGVLALVVVAFAFFSSGLPTRVEIVLSMLNVPIFFGPETVRRLKAKKRVNAMKAEKRKLESEPFHECSLCGANDLTHPEREFRYRDEGAICSECSERPGEESWRS